jgi:hypothetical protein
MKKFDASIGYGHREIAFLEILAVSANQSTARSPVPEQVMLIAMGNR